MALLNGGPLSERTMKKIHTTCAAALLALVLVSGQGAHADDYLPGPEEAMVQASGLFTAEELDELLAPIALYPDPLIAQILPAATFIDQIDEAARYVRQYGQSPLIDNQPWDVSVRSVAHYPDLLYMMDQKYEWTVSLGQAYVNQPQEVFESIQYLRGVAREKGNLISTAQQQVIVENELIRIVPAEPEVIYLPRYDPQRVYVESLPAYGLITFGVGFTIGAWLNRDFDWRQQRIYYHGWQGGGWIDRSRRYVRPRQSPYTRTTYTVINVNPRVVQHDTHRYREDVRRNVDSRRRSGASAVIPDRSIQPRRGSERRGVPPAQGTTPIRVTTVPATNTPRATPPRGTSGAPATPRPGNPGYRGREPQGAPPPANTGYGGYGSSRDATTYRERGQGSRDSTRQINRPQAVPATGGRPGAARGKEPAPRKDVFRRPPPANRDGDRQK